MSVSDAGWLLIEERERPMHVGGLMLFQLPDDAPPDLVRRVVRSAREHDEVRPPFDHKLARPYGLAGLYHWVEDEVELDYHFRHLALPEPGRIRELLSLVSVLHANLLDRHRPLWEMYLFENIEGGRVGVYTKIHHAMLDGVAAIRQVLASFTPDADSRDLPPPWATPVGGQTTAGAMDGGWSPLGQAASLVRQVTDGITSTVTVARAITEQLVRAQRDAAEVAPFQAPPSMLNAKLTPARRFVAQSYDLERIRGVSKTLGATINDVVMAMCAGALRRYLATHDALPDKPLIALVPVSFRRDDSASGNAISLVPANLATHIEDPEARLDLIRSSMDRAKARLRDMSPTELIEYGLLMTAPILIGQLTGLAGRIRPTYNLVISNVPGPDQPLYWNGVPMTGMYPLSLLTDGQAINITQTSYAGSMEFGVTADRRALPSIQRLIDHLEEALVELEAVAG
ncbi:MAG: wax ester/triacylglycerol synthase family O-acyltransferase [Actinobacteria bacterium]|nr:wax ester/triacylglycerol synthase family O-acyltransferase [Actinomycetota bacterium]